jgi:protein O-mannosyl-transferase
LKFGILYLDFFWIILATDMPKKKSGKLTQGAKQDPPKKNERILFSPFSFRQHRLPILVISILAIGLYLQSTGFDYALDDKMVIVDNKFTQKGLEGIADIFRFESFTGYFGGQTELLEGGRYRPLSIATFAVEKEFFGSNSGISHLINMLLYAFSGLLLYRVLYFMFPGEKNKWFFSVPFIASIIFIAHPLHVEVVANIKGRDEILALIGELATIYFSFKWLSQKKTKFLLFSFLAFMAAILSKEGAITFLAVVPLTIHFFSKATAVEKFRLSIPVIVGTILYLIIRVNAIGYLVDGKEVTDLMNNPFYGLDTGEKTATIAYTLLMYLKLLVYPHPLTHDYYPYHIPVMSWGSWQSILSLLIHAGLVLVIIKGWKRKTVWAYAAGFYLITISIVSNVLVSVGIFMNERFVYHASIGFCIAFAWLLSRLRVHPRIPRSVPAILFVFFVLAFSIRTLVRLPDWKNDTTLDKAAIKFSPNSARANCFYGIAIWQNVYLGIPQQDSMRRLAVLDSMSPYFEKSTRILPTYGAALTMRAAVAGEYHKLNRDYDKLLKVFAEINRTGVIEPFVINYLKYANAIVASATDAAKLSAFYKSMIEFYRNNYPGSSLAQEYEKLDGELMQKGLF